MSSPLGCRAGAPFPRRGRLYFGSSLIPGPLVGATFIFRTRLALPHSIVVPIAHRKFIPNIAWTSMEGKRCIDMPITFPTRPTSFYKAFQLTAWIYLPKKTRACTSCALPRIGHLCLLVTAVSIVAGIVSPPIFTVASIRPPSLQLYYRLAGVSASSARARRSRSAGQRQERVEMSTLGVLSSPVQHYTDS